MRRWQDALATLYGRKLLKAGLDRFGVSASLGDIKYGKNGKPYLSESRVCFNISHSGEYVVCAISDEVEILGVDIEKHKTINIFDFYNIWTKEEWKLIQEEDISTFYKFWTRKEAVIKAEGTGLELPLKEISVLGPTTLLNNQLFYLTPLTIDSGYSLHLATSRLINAVNMVRLPV